MYLGVTCVSITLLCQYIILFVTEFALFMQAVNGMIFVYQCLGSLLHTKKLETRCLHSKRMESNTRKKISFREYSEVTISTIK